MARRTPDTTLGGLDLIDEAVHLLRLASPATLLCYYAGAAPFVLAVLFFWSDMSRSGLAEQHLVGGALGLGALFVWMKVWQALFGLKLYAQVAGEPPPRLNPSLLARAAASQALLQSTGLFLLPIALQVLLPLGWVLAFYQNAAVLGLREPSLRALTRTSWRQARVAPMQNHSALITLFLFGLFVFLNIMMTMLFAPELLKMLAGVETHFTLSVWSSVNTTFLAAALGVTYLCFDPLVKSLFVLRCFYGQSRATGEDLRVTLRSFRPAGAALIFLLIFAQPATSQGAPAEKVHPATSEKGEALDRSIERILQRSEYTWRSPRAKADPNLQEESTFWRRIREWLRSIAQSVRDFLDKLFRNRTPARPSSRFSLSTQGLIYPLIGLLLAIVGVLVWLLWRTRSRTTDAELNATPAAAVPDLAREDVTGDELPVDGWMKLALELLERGELRLAMRAFYLSSLAHLAARNLVSIARFKSNRDYERELRRRSHALPELTQTFSENVSVFDRVWYGLHEINADLLQHFRSNVERIRAC